MDDSRDVFLVRRGRGAVGNRQNQFEEFRREPTPERVEEMLAEDGAAVRTQLFVDTARGAITYNNSPDVGFDRSINPYRGCEHGCVYCFARPTHGYLGLSPGLDFETKLFYKPDLVTLLQRELSTRSYRPAPMAVGINTDGYQPVERNLGLTRSALELLVRLKHPFTIVTKSALIERDVDLLAKAAAQHLVQVAVSITTLDGTLARRLEPRAAAPQRRLATVERLSAAGIPVTVLIAPVIPVLTEPELERIAIAARQAGAADVGYVLLRLPQELVPVFTDWLRCHYPGAAEHVISRVTAMRGGKIYDSQFGKRMAGEGVYADLLKQRLRVIKKKLAFSGTPDLDSSKFSPSAASGQLSLF